MKAIETAYNGYRFRSRLEARWAVFFDTLGVSYVYEPEGFELSGGVRYLPDFWLPKVYFRWNANPGLWFEIKGELAQEEENKIQKFAAEKQVAICIAEGAYFSDTIDSAISHYYGDWWDQGLAFLKCPNCRRISVQFIESSYADCENCQTTRQFIHEDHPAYIAARSARFEFAR
jgi:hypothetical protein